MNRRTPVLDERSAGHSASVLALMASVLLGGCSTVRVGYDYDPSASFDGFRRYHLTPPVAASLDMTRRQGIIRPIPQEVIIRRIERSLRAELRQRGFVETNRADADFVVVFTVGARDRTETFADTPPGPDQAHEGQPYSITYSEGNLVIEFLDPDTGRMAWRGWGTDTIARSAAEQEKIRASVGLILDQFPPPS